MSNSAERATELRAQADALDALAHLETELTAAKASGDPDAIRAAAADLREARSLVRTEGTTVGGDAYAETSKEV